MDATTRACMEKMGSIRAGLLRIQGEVADMKRLDPTADFVDFIIDTDTLLRSADHYIAECGEEMRLAA